MNKDYLQVIKPPERQPVQAAEKLEAKFVTGEVAKTKSENTSDKLDVKIRFGRLKRRMRNRSAGIF